MCAQKIPRPFIVVAIWLILFPVLLACDLTLSGSGSEEETGRAPPDQSIHPPPAQPTPGAEQPAAAPEASAGLPELAGLDTLNSYRLNITWHIQNEDGSQSYQIASTEERIRGASPAMRVVVVMPDPDTPGATLSSETIYAGDSAWVKQTDGSWMQFTMEGWQDYGGDFMDTGEIQTWTFVGEETVNGVGTRHYTTSEDTTLDLETEQGTESLTIQGELWVADQPDLPPVIVRQIMQWTGPISPFPVTGNIDPGQTLITRLDAQLADVNAPLTIEPPQLTATPKPLLPTVTLASSFTPSPPPSPTFTPPPLPSPTRTSPPPPSPTRTPPPPPSPTFTPDPYAPPPGFVEQPSYTEDCRNRPAGSICLGFDDGYIWFIAPFNDTVLGWGEAGEWQGKKIQVVIGQRSDYQHILGTNMVRKVDK